MSSLIEHHYILFYILFGHLALKLTRNYIQDDCEYMQEVQTRVSYQANRYVMLVHKLTN